MKKHLKNYSNLKLKILPEQDEGIFGPLLLIFGKKLSRTAHLTDFRERNLQIRNSAPAGVELDIINL